MALLAHVDTHRGVQTAFGKIIPEKEAYSYCLRTIAAFSANIFQVMRHLNDDWEDRTAAITEIANMMNCAACAGSDEELNQYLNQYEAADEVSKDIAKRLINLEEQLAVDIRKFL